MFTNSDLKSKVDSLWNLFWSRVMSNPFTAIELMSYLIFLRWSEVKEHNNQTLFLRTIPTVFMGKHKLEVDDLYKVPFTNFGSNALEKYFIPEEIEEMMELTNKLAA